MKGINVKHNIFEKPYVVTVRRNGAELDMVLWATDEKSLRERLKLELTETIELVSIRER